MKPPPRPTDEARRLEALRQYDLLDPRPEPVLDDLTALAAHLCDVPISVVSVVDDQRQWFKSRFGLSVQETPRDISFCGHTILQRDLVVVPDATQDERFADNPLVTGEMRLRFYAAMPLITFEGYALGTLCVMDREPRQLTPLQSEALRVLTRQAMAQLELRRQTRALGQSERLLRAIFDSEPECVKVLGRDGSLRMMNRAGLALIEADSFGQVSGHCVYPLVAPEQRAQFEAMAARVFGGDSATLEFQMIGLKGTPRWLETHAAPLRDEHGEVTALLGITRDITARKQDEAALRAGEERYRRIVLTAEEGIWTIDAEARTSFANPKMAQMLGYTVAEMQGRALHDFMDAEGRGISDRNLERRQQGITEAHEFKFRRKDGTELWASLATNPILAADGSYAGALAMVTDITTRKRAETALQQAEALYRRAIAGVGAVPYDYDYQSRTYGFMSAEIERLTGYRPEEFCPALWQQIIQECVMLGEGAGLSQAEASNRILRGEIQQWCADARILTRDGKTRWLSDVSVQKHDAAGRVVGSTGILTDITERKQAEVAIQSMSRRMGLIAQMTNAVIGNSTMAEVAQKLTAQVREAFAVDACVIRVLEENQLVLLGAHGVPAGQLAPSLPVFGIAQEIMTARGPVVISDVRNDPRTKDLTRPGPGAYAFVSFAGVPLVAEGAIVGILGIYMTHTLRTFSAVDMEHLQIVANHAAVSLSNEQLFKTVQAQKNQLETLIAAREQAEAAVREERARLAALIDSAMDAVITVDATQRITLFNPAAEKMFGYAATAMAGQPLARLIPPRFQIGHLEHMQAFGQTGVSSRRVGGLSAVTGQRANGEEFPIEVAISQIEVSGQKFFTAILRDVTKHQQAEAARDALLDLQSKLSIARAPQEVARSIFAAADQLWKVDAGSLNVYLPEADLMQAVLNFDVIEGRRQDLRLVGFIGKPTPRLRRVMQQGGELVLRQPPITLTPENVMFGDTSRPSASMIHVPIRWQGRAVGILSVQSYTPNAFTEADVRTLQGLADQCGGTLERIRADSALNESEERFRQLADNIQEVFWMTTPANDQMLYLSPAYEKIWGRTCASLYAAPHTWLDTLHPDDRQRIAHAVATKQHAGDYDETYRIQRPDGSIRWIRDRAFPIRDAAGEILRLVGTAEDITERRQLEEQLRQSQKMEAIGQLAGGVAHDFNNILAAIMMQAELVVTTEPLSPEARDYINEIKASAERAANLTRQLLAFSRRQVMQSRPLDLNEIVTSLVKMLHRVLGADVRLQLNLHPRELLTCADAGMLDQVLLNLVINARDAMPGGGRLIIETSEKNFTVATAALIPDAKPGRYACLRVTDTGMGIAPENLTRIFEPFFTTKEVGKGTGLGLATVFGIIKQHGGALAVASEVGRGTSLQIFLPATAAGEPAATAIAKTQPGGGTETILLVEDEASVRRLTRVVLERAGYQVLEAADGVAALRLWEQHQAAIRLLLTDMVMPEGISGRELAARLQARSPQLRVLFTSGYSAEIAGRELALHAGQNFIQKPTTPDQILETVRRCLDR